MQINQQSLLITGGASGMGHACAKIFSEQGAKVAIIDKDKAELGLSLQCDVTDPAQVDDAFKQIIEANGVPRIAINCAGIAPASRLVGRDGPHDFDLFHQTIHVNLLGTFNVMRLAAAAMMEVEPVGADGERGVIINTASVAAFEGQIGQVAYSASKGGIVSMTLPAARELAKFGIRVNCIAPGLMATPMLLNMPEDVQSSLAASVPFPHRLGAPEEFAKLCAHVIDNPMINGETIRLDGALRMAAK
jgi:NAD(P)-dependent dehydrogenase (short-subunit alcohol dehydrogenase family)